VSLYLGKEGLGCGWSGYGEAIPISVKEYTSKSNYLISLQELIIRLRLIG